MWTNYVRIILAALYFGYDKTREPEPKKMGDTNNILRTGGSGWTSKTWAKDAIGWNYAIGT